MGNRPQKEELDWLLMACGDIRDSEGEANDPEVRILLVNTVRQMMRLEERVRVAERGVQGWWPGFGMYDEADGTSDRGERIDMGHGSVHRMHEEELDELLGEMDFMLDRTGQVSGQKLQALMERTVRTMQGMEERVTRVEEGLKDWKSNGH